MVNNIDIVGVGKKRKHGLSTDRELLSLKEYYTIARKLIKKNHFAMSNNILSNEDIMSQIVYSIITADIHYNGKGSLYGYRKTKVDWTIKSYLLRRKKNASRNIESIDNKTNTSKSNESYCSDVEDYRKTPLQTLLENEDSQKVKEKIYNIVWGSSLSDKAKNCVWKYYIESENVQDIADSYGTTKQAVYYLINTSVAKLRPLIIQDRFLKHIVYER